MKKHLFLLVFMLTFSISQNISAQINTATGGAASVLPNSVTTNTNVGVGTNAPKSKLDIEGGVSIGATYSGTTASPANGAIIEGNVGIGTNAPASRLHITSATAGTSGLRFTNLISTTATTSGLLGKALSVNATGDVVLVPVANTDTSLFIANGALASARTVTMSGFGLTFNPSTANSQFFINGTNGNTGIGNVTPTTRLEVTSGTAGDSGVKLTNLLSTSTATTANGKALSVDTTGKVILVPVPTSTGAIDANASLTASRTATMAGFNYTFNPSTANSQFFINGASGNTGIGNVTPTTRLEVTSGTANDSGFKLTNLTSASTTVAANGKALSVDTTGKVVLVPVSGTDANASLTAARTVTMGGFDYTFNPSTANSQFFINGTNGNVGIGSIIPSANLEVNTNVPTQATYNSQKWSTASNSEYNLKLQTIWSNSGINYQFTQKFNSVEYPSLSFFAGNVGIGTSTPTAKFEVSSGTANDSGLKLTNLTSASTTVTANGKALSVDDAGKVILVPAATASVGGTLYTENGTLTGVGDRVVALGGKNLSFNASNNAPFFVNGTDGKVGIGITTPTVALDVLGDVKASQGVFTNSQPDGQTFATGQEAYTKSRVLTAGKLMSATDGYEARMFNFYDVPQSNQNLKSFAQFNIEDRNYKTRFKFTAETGGATDFQMNTRDQQNAFRVVEEGDDKVTMTLPKPNTKVGIGTSTPTEKLDVVGNVKATKAIFPGNELVNQTYTNYDNAIDSSIVFSAGKTNPLFPNRRLFDFYDMSMASPFAVNAVGFKMSDRLGKNRFNIDLYEGSSTELQMLDKDQAYFFTVKDYGTAQGAYMQIPKPNSKVIIGGYANDAIIGTHSFVVKGSSLIQGNFLTDGNIGIGTPSFLDSADNKTYRLSVKGRIRAEEVKVYNTWADYVFNKEYNLRSLNDLEAYIKANGHLPNVPSAKEVTEKGLELGEMTKIQQEKIEELTLYLIQQNKEIQELKAQMKALMEKK